MRRLILLMLALPACARLSEVGKAPSFTSANDTFQYHAMYALPLPEDVANSGPTAGSSLWAGDRASLLGDRRASRRGDILTVAIEIDDRAEISNSTGRSRSGGETLGLPSFFGLPQRIDRHLPEGASMAEAVSTKTSSNYAGDGSVRRKEKMTLRIAATVVEELPNGVLRIQGQQEVRVNYELRELIVTGYVRPGDISRQNEITYDKIAEARISYGGRGQITDVQQPRYGQQVADIILPF
ncbi:flagellar basal body L-ring protein FlgH [Cereibacter johrii]|uniref:Flagellar L-ring protein n=1 Tax=Cereibacter johrii TaxID=445629 RepID=A0ABX5J6P4_9RHOB|nr:flagellar basal body L-ring protein FlgH [Cereibacter johrii]QCP87078.1 flagellar basal body L-ring protein FlgH [Cereibacter sphaeroides]MEA5159225.1 flagellar basal body L-ring protein FlgH [Cereibacter johrii]ODM44056.1 flagellar basal body L-ring protein [Cereibacter johrii]PTM77575.1 flagellar L-ring protein precursor FlgH [Cereibacter johrii]RAZ85795.1 flagellar basal body L-ring protein FlgH [Cereibacter johrii]